MLFKTIRIPKKLSFILCIAAAAAAIGTGSFILWNHRTTTVFRQVDTDYTKILDEGLPSEQQDFNIKNFVNRLLGFNTERPESVVGEFSPIFRSDDTNTPAEITPSETPVEQPTEPPQETAAPEPESPQVLAKFPTKESIDSGEKLEINNATTYSVDLKQLCAQPLDFTIEKNAEPQVLIVHTHTTECFDGDAMSGETERNADEEKNITAVGNVIAEVLENNGIHCVHDKTVHDYPSYQGAYTRTLSTIDYNLKQYPNIKVVLDIHRDAFVYPDGSKLTVRCDVNGVSTAKVMLVLGTDSLGLSHPNWKKNLSLAAKVQSAANQMYPGMMRPINLRRERFNMHMTTGSMLIEVGSNGNTLDEAKEGGKNIANALSAVLTQE